MKKTFFVTGIGTDVGKTIVSAIITEALQADYWKPIQAGDLKRSDSIKVKELISNSNSIFHEAAYNLNTPMSPHAAAELDGVRIDMKSISRPSTNNSLVIEGAGGLLVPINKKETVFDLIQPSDTIIVVSRHYLGSINHTLLTLSALAQRKFKNIFIIFSGNENPGTESSITKFSGIRVLGRIENEPFFDKNVVLEYAEKFSDELTRTR